MYFYLFSGIGKSQQIFGENTARNSDNTESDRGVVNLLQKFSSRIKPSLSPGTESSTSALLHLHNVATARFKKEMAMMFSWLPEPHQCKALKTFTTLTGCRMSDVIHLLLNLTDLNHVILNVTCLDNSLTRLKACAQMNSSFVKETLYNELVNLFASLPPPFMCNIINNIALAYKFKGRRHLEDRETPSMSISQAQNEVARILPSVQLPQSCADVGNSRVPTIPAVNLTVNLTNRDKKSWLDAFKKKGPEIYKIVVEYEEHNFHKGKLMLMPKWPGSSEINEKLINDTQLIISALNDGNETFSVLFGLKVKRKLSGRLRDMRSTHKIVEALRAAKQKKLNLILGADVVNINLKRGQLNTTEQTTGSDNWSLMEISKAKELFPDYLSAYYKQLEKPARCFIMFYISLTIKKTPTVLEMFYSSFGLFSRKHACYYTKRIINPHIHTIIGEIFTPPTTVISTTVPMVNSTKKTDHALNHMSEEFDMEDVSALEISLFCLLGLFCVAVVSFTINCVIFAFKTKSLSLKEPGPTTVLRTAVFRKGSNGAVAGSEVDSVHVTVEQTIGTAKPVGAQTPLPANDVIKSCSVAAFCERKSLSCISQPEKKRMVLEMSGEATSCLSNTNSGSDTRRVRCLGCPPTEQSHEMVFVMLNCKGVKEERV